MAVSVNGVGSEKRRLLEPRFDIYGCGTFIRRLLMLYYPHYQSASFRIRVFSFPELSRFSAGKCVGNRFFLWKRMPPPFVPILGNFTKIRAFLVLFQRGNNSILQCRVHFLRKNNTSGYSFDLGRVHCALHSLKADREVLFPCSSKVVPPSFPFRENGGGGIRTFISCQCLFRLG